ncbi:MAG TPA: transglycosylase SLT domain-containing protein [Alcanivoracaceae bacterium]|nr:transglycosylase SLT domain-containing protein [Alcanivoracaceae bacterium]
MRHPIGLLFISTSLFLLGCSSWHAVDDYAPMPAATEDNKNIESSEHISPPIFSPAKATEQTASKPTKGKNKPPKAVTNETIWARISAGYQLGNPPQNSAIERYRNQYVTHPQHTQNILLRGGRYLHFIVEELEKRDMPLELALLPMVESAYDPFVVSSGKAAGPWQFIPSTGKAFGLTQNAWQDDRRDIIASTTAALDYLERIAKRFDGDWLLAIAAYNAGPGNVSRAIRRNKSQGKPTDYWHLNISRENAAYLPKLFAVADIVRNADKYNLALPHVANEPYFQVVPLPGQIQLQQAAELTGVSLEEIQLLNAASKGSFTPPNGPHRLLVPAANTYAFTQHLKTATLFTPTSNKTAPQKGQYVVRSGDSLSVIAQRFNTTVKALQLANGIDSHRILVGQELVIR